MDDPFATKSYTFKFGKSLCQSNELMPKSIILGKNGNRVYFIKRDHNRKVDEMMSVQLLPSRADGPQNVIEADVEKIYDSNDARIIHFGLDFMAESITAAKDVFFILTSDKKMSRLVESEQLTEGD